MERLLPSSPNSRHRDRLSAKLSSLWKKPKLASNKRNAGTALVLFRDSEESPDSLAKIDSGSNSDRYNQLWLQAEQLLSDGSESDKYCAEKFKKYLSPSNGAFIADGEAYIEELQALVAKKQREADANALKVTIGSKTYVVRDLASKIIVWLNRLKEVGDVAVSFDPTHAALPWAAFRFLLQAVTINNEHAGKLLIGLERITSLCLRCRIHHQLYLSEKRPALSDNVTGPLKTSIITLFKEILSFISMSVEYCERGLFEKTIKGTFQPDKFSARLTALEDEAEKVERAANNCYHLSVISGLESVTDQFSELHSILDQGFCRVDDALNGVWTSMQANEYIDMLKWISDIPYQSDYENARASRLTGTCEWLLRHEKYAQWRDSSCSTTLWLHGIPGAGKTRLATRVVDDISSTLDTTSNSEGFAYFFCDRNRSDRQDPGSVLRSLIRQLSSKPEIVRAKSGQSELDIMDCTRQRYHGKKATGFASSRFTIEECRDLLNDISKGYAQITVLIDGLDECDHKSRHLLIDALDDVVSTSPGLVKVFIASRDDDDIKQKYGGGHNLRIQASDNQADIDKYVAHKIDQTKWCRTGMPPEMRDEVIQTFRRKSQGMFQWVVLHIDSLLELDFAHLVYEHLDGLPEGLKASYDDIYESIDKRKRYIADRAFQWMMCSWKPLTPFELAIAVFQSPDGPFQPDVDVGAVIDMVLKTCKNLVMVEMGENFDICRFAHLSVQEYLESYHFDPIQANDLVLSVHLRYLFHLKQPITKRYSPEDNDWTERMMVWDQQARPFAGAISEATRNLMVRFLDSPFKGSSAYDIWIESLSVFQGSGSSVSMYDSSVLEGLPWLACVVFEFYDVLVEWLRSGLLKPEDMIVNGRSPLFFTYPHKDPLIWNTLVEFGAGVNGMVHYGWTPLIFAASLVGGYRDAKPLLEHGADPNLVFEDSCSVPVPALHKACQTREAKMISLLLEHGADINKNVRHVGTPLQVTIFEKQWALCQILIKAGADLNGYGRYVWTPLMTALKRKNMGIARLIIASGADINAATPDGGTALHAAISSTKHGVKLLVEKKANMNLYSTRYGSPLYYAFVVQKKAKLSRMLRMAGADLDTAHGEYENAEAVAALRAMDWKILDSRRKRRHKNKDPEEPGSRRFSFP
ncbi:uncharacterized protein F4822DRAFT_263886 [Hypoxylon trugodes]|uniref:uncharacterized protein n=1 Tax=Hypoxylon trugodes TaxID=326681 RepID=UPI0021948FB4|nr:uncharacterized protein F4822DRAFT_263886 [Hypoxylon trugodes]KAI1388967.1 hypothetical protein F4822DRAFT_263886 [Hypoxylon trugodes]